jgi:serine/threonine-protein kinase HipA
VTYTPATVVRVDAWGETVGAVALDPRTGLGVFEFEPRWIASGRELSPFLAPLATRRVVGESRSRDTFLGLPPFLADSLPDDFGNAIVDAFLAREGIATGTFTSLDRLVYAGGRAIGALEFYPPTPRSVTPSALDLSSLVTDARRALQGDLEEAARAVRSLFSVGTSAGGARAKAVIAIDAKGHIRSGSLPPAAGWTDYLLKFDGTGNDAHATDGYTRVEYAYHLMAGAAGMTVPEARLLEEGGRAHFLTRRFDRGLGVNGLPERVHLQSLCAMRGVDFRLIDTHDYGQYLATIIDLGLGADALREGFRRAAFNVAAYNRDDHTKNVAFLMDRTGRWHLAPAFDLTFSYRPDSMWVARHQMAVDGVFDNPAQADLRRLGDRWGVPAIDETLDDVAAAIARWPEFSDAAGVDPARRDRIGALISPK